MTQPGYSYVCSVCIVLVHYARQNAIAKITASVVASAAIEQAQWSMVSLIKTKE